MNPVSLVNKYLLDTLKREHTTALESERAARTFRQYRLNNPGDPVEAQPLITSAEWERIVSRPVPPCEGRPVVGVDFRRNEIMVGRRVPCGRMVELKAGRLLLVNRVWPTRSARTR